MEEQQIAILTACIVITLLVLLMVVLFVLFQRKKNRLLQEQNETKEQFEKIINLDITLEELLYAKSSTPPKSPKTPILNSAHITEKLSKSSSDSESQAQIALDEIAITILERLQEFEQSKGFLNKDISVHSLAKQIHTNSKYLSKTINIHKGQKFTTYINGLRIQYVKERLAEDVTFRKYTIASIAAEVGFNTPHTFSTAFYKHTQVYPSTYIKQLNQNTSAT